MPYKDKEKQKQAQKKHYENNKDLYRKSSKENRAERKLWFQQLKSRLKCMKCDESSPFCLDFHHINSNEKLFTVSSAVHFGYSKELILVEIQKCEVLCANCHILAHSPVWAGCNYSIYRSRNLEWLNNYKNKSKCFDCSESRNAVLSFHHNDPKKKFLAVSLMAWRGFSIDNLIEEINKCILLCANCHRKRHFYARLNIW